MQSKAVVAQAPGKIILSGEHAVVHGAPALAMAINLHTTTTLENYKQHNIIFYLKNLGYTSKTTITKLRALKERAQHKYQQFLNNECTIKDVLHRSLELLEYAFIQITDKFHLHVPEGLKITTSSTIPPHCGLGSSAASLVSFIHALNHFLELDIDILEYFELARQSENLQHGISSGLDLHLAINGGCTYFANKTFIKKTLPKTPLTIINTGSAAVSTGETVAHTSKILQNNTKLLAGFAEIPTLLSQAIESGDIESMRELIKINHKLLKQINVVPNKVDHFITDIEKLGGAAKICGAGTLKGDDAGVILISCDQNIDNLIQKFNYTKLNCTGDTNGVRIISS
ncbi:MAG: mevalonate kinase [Gammaproteobacteria bacterium]|nr:mevalonate kinase [Gammaproteobacteria bacterium]